MHDSVATFYGGYDQAGLGRLPRLKISRIVLAMAVALLLLVVFVAADVAAIEAFPASVHVTEVNWFIGNQSIANISGFAAHSSQTFVLTETCELFCFNFNGATVSAPFQLVHVSIVNEPIQYTNLTIQAPASAYSGPLAIYLEVG